MHVVFKDQTFSFELLRALSYGPYRGADVGECLKTAFSIKAATLRAGQGALIREQTLPFRPDWEQVVTPVVDFALTLPEVEPARIALMRISLGGYLAPRAAAFEYPLAAPIADDGVYTYQFGEKARIVSRVAALFGRLVAHYLLNPVMQRNSGIRWAIENGLFTFQVGSIWDLIDTTQGWSLHGVADQIICPTLLCAAAGDQFFAGQPRLLYDALTCPKDLHVRYGGGWSRGALSDGSVADTQPTSF